MSLSLEYEAAKAALAWQLEMGADEAIGEVPINRYEEPEKKPKLKVGPSSNIAPIDIVPQILPVEEAAPDVAKILAEKCGTLEELRNSLALFDLCALKKGARNMVFGQGSSSARVMIIGEAPTRDEDREGKSFVGTTGDLLDKMLMAINMDRNSESSKDAVYSMNVVPWRPPQARGPNREELAMLRPFLEKQIRLVDPELIILMGNTACETLLGKSGLARFRGTWHEVLDRPALPMFHPEQLMRDPSRKREAWADLLAVKEKLLG